MTQNPQPISILGLPERDEAHFDLGDSLDTLYDNRKLIAIITLIVSMLGFAYALLATPIYRSDILIQVEDSPTSANNVLSGVASMFDVKTAASDEMEILKSRKVVWKTVEEQRLYLQVRPRYFPLIGRWVASFADTLSTPGLFGLGGYVWGNERADVIRFETPSSMYDVPFTIAAQGRGRYLLHSGRAGIDARGEVGRVLHVSTPDGDVDLLIARLDAKPGARFVMRRFSIQQTVERLQSDLQISMHGKDSNVISVRLDGADPERVKGTLAEIGKQYVQQNIERKAEEAAKSLAFLDGEWPKAKAALEKAEAAFNTFRTTYGALSLGEEASAVLQQSVDAQGRLTDLQQKRQDLSARFTEQHPALIGVNDQIRELRARMGQIDERARRLPDLQQTAVRLQRDVQINSDLYTNLLSTTQQLRLLRAGKTGNARLVDEARAAELPVKPNRPLVAALSVLAGLCLGCGVAWVRKTLFGGIRHPYDVERVSGVPVYAAVPHSREQAALHAQMSAGNAGLQILARSGADTAAIESLRSFRTALQFALLDAPNNVVLISGPTPGVGKSFISMNVAAVLAASSQRVLLLEGDLRKGYLHRYLGMPSHPGLSDLLAGTAATEDVIRRQVLPNLDFVSRGTLVDNPAELLTHDNLRAFIEAMKTAYDIVIIDSPPVLPVADTAALGRLAGLVFVVVRQNATRAADVRETVRRLGQVGIKPRGMVFNDMTPRPGNYGYGYGRYRYSDEAYGKYRPEPS
ncbi:Putative tyrosine-protein kinase in cps region [Pandoraea terrae]|uniref:Putative tyrosine-protein kinase EpsB n=1 Tax=Pandoraea terrae TaxID=1537710 RepID=A0A5E4URK9_9BURK|nr:polysaccharide biosynthesis tyrosine autokinase [Pandoraea terrae]VVE02567.1 Putative tyrosine-protein kinase in cps region [Pandoraea terrae]